MAVLKALGWQAAGWLDTRIPSVSLQAGAGSPRTSPQGGGGGGDPSRSTPGACHNSSSVPGALREASGLNSGPIWGQIGCHFGLIFALFRTLLETRFLKTIVGK